MKKTQKLVASILVSFFLFANITMLPVYATDKIFNKTKSQDIDRTGPTIGLNSLQIDKKEVQAGDKITLSLKANDMSGIDFVTIFYTTPNTHHDISVPLHYNSETKLYTGIIDIDDTMENGTWYINSIIGTDTLGNATCLPFSKNDLENLNFTISKNNPDTTPPNVDLNSIKVNKKTAKVGDTITLSFNASDDRSGIQKIIVYYCPLKGEGSVRLNCTYNSVTNLYEASIVVSNDMVGRDWGIGSITIFDNSYNANFYDNSNYDFSNSICTINN